MDRGTFLKRDEQPAALDARNNRRLAFVALKCALPGSFGRYDAHGSDYLITTAEAF